MHEQATLMLASSGALIDVDSTLLIQFVLFSFMGLVASRLLFKPYLKMREERAAGIEGAKADAERMQAEAAARLADYEDKLAAARSRAQVEQRKIRAEAATHEHEVTAKARAAANESIASARQTVDREVASARKELMPKADEIARDVASKLLGREVA
jgi:F-type H+-transporting ATPase subunit b